MDINTINRIVWWIPFKKLRNDVRKYLMKSSKMHDINDRYFIGYIQNDIENNRNELLYKYRKLINGLDNESTEIVSNIVSALSRNNMYFTDNEVSIKEDLRKKHNNKIIKINNELYIYDNKYILNRDFFEFPNFYDKIGLDHVKNTDFIKDKAIIDAGGFIGDTALILSEYTNDKVYSFEPFLSNLNSMKKNIVLNNKSNVEPVYMALGDQNKEIYIDDSNVSSGNVLNIKNTGNKVQMTTLDSFVEKNNIKVGLIKTDLEGFEQPFLRGALNTIKKQKPVLIISIYHNYSDFFDIKPMIEELDLGYKFKILKSNDFNIILETKLIAEVY
ncbi:FkbM family methyltransferase [Brachyspira murdochii]|uniref:FkbM family methyltransferase n=1 Tax=Brachyspira murdochii TaxID=84378 RepID=UPI0012F50112|nr:FkbM family methyltransferase [Brachyspira murdochii]